MKYERIEKAVFLERENRFVAYVELEGKKRKSSCEKYRPV